MNYTTHTQQAIPSSSRDEQATAQADGITQFLYHQAKSILIMLLILIRNT